MPAPVRVKGRARVKFRIERDVLADAVTWVARGLPARPPVPVLAGVRIEADAEGRVTAIHTLPRDEARHYANLVNAALYAVRRGALRPFAGAGKLDFTKEVLPGLIARGANVLAYRSAEYIKDLSLIHI